jgi:hypothetical protein
MTHNIGSYCFGEDIMPTPRYRTDGTLITDCLSVVLHYIMTGEDKSTLGWEDQMKFERESSDMVKAFLLEMEAIGVLEYKHVTA